MTGDVPVSGTLLPYSLRTVRSSPRSEHQEIQMTRSSARWHQVVRVPGVLQPPLDPRGRRACLIGCDRTRWSLGDGGVRSRRGARCEAPLQCNRQAPCDVGPFGRLEVEGHAPLVARHGLPPDALTVLRGAVVAERISAGRVLDLDHLCASRVRYLGHNLTCPELPWSGTGRWTPDAAPSRCCVQRNAIPVWRYRPTGQAEVQDIERCLTHGTSDVSSFPSR